MIKHLVVSGGGTYCFQAFGALMECHKKGIWNINNIESCYGTSVGVILLVMLVLKYQENELTTYLVDRPWQNVFKYEIYTILNSFKENGFFGIDSFKQILSPLLSGMEMEDNVTMQELYEKTNIDFHIYITDVNDFKTIDISHKTHPNWGLVEAAYSSCCIPIFYKPFEKEGRYFIDGGVFLNYPLEECLKVHESNEILGIKKTYDKVEPITPETSLFEYLNVLIMKTTKKIHSECISVLNYEITIPAPPVAITDIFSFANSKSCRQENINTGRKIARKFIKKWKSTSKPN